MPNLEEKLRQWTSPSSDNEDEKCERAVRMIKQAVEASTVLRSLDIDVRPQGSYHNNTNVRLDSDVDVGVICRNTVFFDLPPGTQMVDFGFSPTTYPFADFKRDLEAALVDKFGRPAVTPGNKAFDIKASSARVEADVAPFFEHRRYASDGTFIRGVELLADNGASHRVINWPDQHYENGVLKNNATGRRYKSVVRVLKRAKNELEPQGAISPAVRGFLIECLVWNTPNDFLTKHSTLTQTVRSVILFLYEQLSQTEKWREWGEVSELKYLFSVGQRWSEADAKQFCLAAWNLFGFK